MKRPTLADLPRSMLPAGLLAPLRPVRVKRKTSNGTSRVKPDASAFFTSYSLMPQPVREYRFHPERKWRFDYAWTAEKVALEVEGGVWTGGRHTRGAGFLRDVEKYNAAAVLGWCVIRCTPSTLGTAETAALLLKGLMRRFQLST